VTEPHDDGYEILDLGRRRRADTSREPRALPPLRLGDERPAEDRTEAPTPPWRRLMAFAAAFAVGLAVGAFVWNARDNAAELAAAEQEADLIAGPIEGGTSSGQETQRFTVAMLNAGSRDIEVLSIRPAGWTLPDDERSQPQPAPAGEWTNLRMATVPDCEAPPPQELHVRVRTEARERAVTVTLPPGHSRLTEVHQAVCGGDFSPYGATVVDIRVIAQNDPDTLVMELVLKSNDPALDFDVVDVNASAAGFRAEATNLPVSFRSNLRTPSRLLLAWQVQNCELSLALDARFGLKQCGT
jgi:hypothetical protein